MPRRGGDNSVEAKSSKYGTKARPPDVFTFARDMERRAEEREARMRQTIERVRPQQVRENLRPRYFV